MAPGRKVPFSAKAKKEQLKAKRDKKNSGSTGGVKPGKKRNILLKARSDDSDSEGDLRQERSKKLNFQPSKAEKAVNRYALQFYKETKEELAERKEEARQTIVPVPETALEISFDQFFPSDFDFPRRPPWNYDMTRDELENTENKYFMKYVSGLEEKFGARNLSYFELNLETWRQLWRVLEMSDIILIIVDIRFPTLLFPPSVYKFVSGELKKEMILVLNKIDLVPAHVVVAWKHYFKKIFPKLHIITFTSFPSYNLRNVPTENKSGLQVRRRRGRQKMAAEGALKLYEACSDIVQKQVDLSSWHEKILEEMEEDEEIDDEEKYERNLIDMKPDTGYEEHIKYKDGALTIGCIGQPNVGKSSLMNAIMGKKVVSVSRTPGHTKHFQTIYLTSNVRLCDCPGLVFPSKVPRTLQILTGSYPIAQVREPYTAVKFLSERIDLPRMLNIQHPENDDTWSAMDVCDGWAKKRGFHTAKAARLDSYRAANGILRMALDGKICLSFKPPQFHAKKEEWRKHPEVEEISWIQAKKAEADALEEKPISDEENTNEESEDGSDEEEADEAEDEEEVPSANNKFALLGED